jgi:hypothetical protein
MHTQTRPKIQDMAHLHAIEKDVYLALVGRIPEKQTLVAMQGVESLVGCVSQASEQCSGLSSPPAQRDKINVFIDALETRIRARRGALKINRHTPQEAQRNIVRLGGSKNTGSLLFEICNRCIICMSHKISTRTTGALLPQVSMSGASARDEYAVPFLASL